MAMSMKLGFELSKKMKPVTLPGIVVLFFRSSQEISVPGMRMGLSGSGSAFRRSGSRSKKKKWHFEVHAEETLDDSPYTRCLGLLWVILESP